MSFPCTVGIFQKFIGERFSNIFFLKKITLVIQRAWHRLYNFYPFDWVWLSHPFIGKKKIHSKASLDADSPMFKLGMILEK